MTSISQGLHTTGKHVGIQLDEYLHFSEIKGLYAWWNYLNASKFAIFLEYENAAVLIF